MTVKAAVKHWPPGEPPGPEPTETASVFPPKQAPQTQKENK